MENLDILTGGAAGLNRAFSSLDPSSQAAAIRSLPQNEQLSVLRRLAPDDAADLLQHLPKDERAALLDLLDPISRREINALLTYAEDVAGGLMNPRYAHVRRDVTVREAMIYWRKQSRNELAAPYYMYVLDGPKLSGVVSLRELLSASPDAMIEQVMTSSLTAVDAHSDQEEVARTLRQSGLVALPVVDADGCLKGIVTLDDIVNVVEKEATRDFQMLGGSEALDMPYIKTSLLQMIRKRAGWLVTLFIGEMATASAMNAFADEIAQAVVLALFIPLVISSGGNAGSQASTLVIRAMALGEVRLRDVWKVVGREFISGTALGVILASIGFARVVAWHFLFKMYGDHYLLVAATLAFSLVGIVLWGTLAGSVLPFILKRLRFDPASACAPFVATFVDVTGLTIYFGVAAIVLRGTLL